MVAISAFAAAILACASAMETAFAAISLSAAVRQSSSMQQPVLRDRFSPALVTRHVLTSSSNSSCALVPRPAAAARLACSAKICREELNALG
jgi:hypothetical protein